MLPHNDLNLRFIHPGHLAQLGCGQFLQEADKEPGAVHLLHSSWQRLLYWNMHWPPLSRVPGSADREGGGFTVPVLAGISHLLHHYNHLQTVGVS